MEPHGRYGTFHDDLNLVRSNTDLRREAHFKLLGTEGADIADERAMKTVIKARVCSIVGRMHDVEKEIEDLKETGNAGSSAVVWYRSP